MATRQVGPYSGFTVGASPPSPQAIQLPSQAPMLSVMVNNRSAFTVLLYPNQTSASGTPQSIAPYTETTALLDTAVNCYVAFSGVAGSAEDYINIVFSDQTATSQTSNIPIPPSSQSPFILSDIVSFTTGHSGETQDVGNPLIVPAGQSIYVTFICVTGADLQRFLYQIAVPGIAVLNIRGNFIVNFSAAQLWYTNTNPIQISRSFYLTSLEYFTPTLNLAVNISGYLQ